MTFGPESIVNDLEIHRKNNISFNRWIVDGIISESVSKRLMVAFSNAEVKVGFNSSALKFNLRESTKRDKIAQKLGSLIS